MKKLVILMLALVAGLVLSAQEKKDKKKKNEEVTFAVNMYCENCKTKIEKNISWEKGVKDLTVNLEKKTVTIVYDPQKTTEEKLKKAIEKLGYTAKKEGRKENSQKSFLDLTERFSDPAKRRSDLTNNTVNRVLYIKKQPFCLCIADKININSKCMSKVHWDYIPKKDSELVPWSANFTAGVAANASA